MIGRDESGKDTLWLIRPNQEANVGVCFIGSVSTLVQTSPDWNENPEFSNGVLKLGQQCFQ